MDLAAFVWLGLKFWNIKSILLVAILFADKSLKIAFVNVVVFVGVHEIAEAWRDIQDIRYKFFKDNKFHLLVFHS